MTYHVRAKRWEHGWELHIAGIGVTQSRTLPDADRMVRDYIETLTGENMRGADVIIRPDLGGLEDEVAASREHTEAATRAQRKAAAEARKIATRLRKSGLSVTDTAAVLGVSRGRVSQLVSEAGRGGGNDLNRTAKDTRPTRPEGGLPRLDSNQQPAG